MTQCEEVLQHMQKYGSITPRDAVKHYDIYRLASRISDLKKKDIKIKTEYETHTNRFGRKSRYARYSLCS